MLTSLTLPPVRRATTTRNRSLSDGDDLLNLRGLVPHARRQLNGLGRLPFPFRPR